MSDWKTIVKGCITSIEIKDGKGGRDVRITCSDNKTADQVEQKITQNKSTLAPGYNKTKNKLGKSFVVCFDVSANATAFYNNVQAILEDKSVETDQLTKEDFQKSDAGGASEDEFIMTDDMTGALSTSGGGNNTMIIAAVAVAVVLVIVVCVVWMRKK